MIAWARNHPEQIKAKNLKNRIKPESIAKAAHAWRRRKYGLSAEDFLTMLDEQQGLCKICHVKLEMHSKVKNDRNTVCVDHNHITGKVRGLLCVRCNMGLGHFRDNFEILKSAVEYIQSSEAAVSIV